MTIAQLERENAVLRAMLTDLCARRLGGAAARVMLALAFTTEQDGLTIGQLVVTTKMSRQAIHMAMWNLRNRGLVSSRPDPLACNAGHPAKLYWRTEGASA